MIERMDGKNPFATPVEDLPRDEVSVFNMYISFQLPASMMEKLEALAAGANLSASLWAKAAVMRAMQEPESAMPGQDESDSGLSQVSATTAASDSVTLPGHGEPDLGVSVAVMRSNDTGHGVLITKDTEGGILLPILQSDLQTILNGIS